jgi:hypothetical protein
MKKTIILALLVAGTNAHADNLSDRVRECKAIDEDAARLACYDGLVRAEVSAAPTAPAAPAASVAPAAPVAEVASPPPAPASLGAETMRQKDRTGEAAEKVEVSATVTRCGENADGRYVFYFSNGQVWKQSKDDRVHFSDCNFDVTITKDFFGYKMQQEGEKRRIRIKRLK